MFSEQQVAAMLEGGQIDGSAYYWTEGMTEWRPVAEIIQSAEPNIAGSVESFEAVRDTARLNSTECLTAEELSDICKRRSNAFVIDLMVAALIVGAGIFVKDLAGVAIMLAAFIYLVLKDGLPNGQSVGKRLYGIRTINQLTREPCGVLGSLRRNGLLLVVALGPSFILGAIIIVFFKTGGSITAVMAGYIVWLFIREREQMLQPPFGQMQTEKATKTRVVRAI